MHSSQEMWKLVFRALIQKTHGRACICMSFPIKISWDHRIWVWDFLCSGRRGCPVSFRVLDLLVSLLHTERVQGCAGVCRLEMKANLQTGILGKNTVGLWLSSWFCFMPARCWCFSVAASPRPAERHRLHKHRQISLKKPCLGIMNLHAKYEWKFMVFWILGGG